ncbi:DnaJ C-terminal domain-containing protein [Rhabdaerophilum sp.]|uniref:DnaJ C-terminal domain-containing protein n=1 Tax=Rhabdaerophilum sp. TaxID=2717341 RepID=UPI0038D45BCB
MPDPYQTLGVKRDASADEIKRAYRKLAKTYHPDHNRGDAKAATRFAEVNNAYEILGDETKRRQFDRGEIDADGKPRAFSDLGGGGGFPGGGAGGFKFDFGGGPGGNPRDIFSDLFRQFEGGPRDPFAGQAKGSGRRGPPPGEDITVETSVPLERVASGGAHRVTMPDGRTLEINVPKGVANGATMRLRGQGHPSPFGAANGDALVTIRFAKHPTFGMEGNDLRVSVPVPIRDAVLGGSVRVPTLTGEVEVTVPAWTSGGKTLRLRGKGLPRGEQTGDLLVTLEIDLGPHDPEVEGFFRGRPG